MSAQDFPVTQPYGYDPSYPLNNGFHKGVDYGCPTGTPVVVNGVQIGLSGATGAVTGPHLHVGRWVNGQPTDPGNGGFSFTNAVVTQVSSDATNGNYVRVQADGASWVYLHLSQQTCSVGQELKGDVMDHNAGIALYRAGLHREPESSDVADQWNGQTPAQALDVLRTSGEWQAQDNLLKTAPQIIADMQTTINGLSTRPTNADYARVQVELNDSVNKLQAVQDALEAERSKPPVVVEKPVVDPQINSKLDKILNLLKVLPALIGRLIKRSKQ